MAETEGVINAAVVTVSDSCARGSGKIVPDPPLQTSWHNSVSELLFARSFPTIRSRFRMRDPALA